MTHILSEIKVTNFKSIKSETFELSAFTPLVGYNNAGKSNILEATKWLLRKSSLSDTYFNNKSRSIEIEGKISGITTTILDQLVENQRTSIESYLLDNSLYIKREQLTPGASVTQIKLYIKDPSNGEWKPNPTGIDQAIQALFPEPIHIGAMENSEEDVSKNKSTTTIGKLLSEILVPVQENYTDTVQQALDDVRNLLEVDGTERATELTEFDDAVNGKLDSIFPGISIKVHIPAPELKDIFSKGTIKVYEDTTISRDVSALGNGAQRSIQMALVRHLADIKRNSGEQLSNTILLIDEPELYLHPQAIEVLRDALKTLSNQGYQIVFSTHSPFMITSEDVRNTLLIRKSLHRGTYKRNSLKNAVPQIVSDSPSQLALVFSLSNSSNILFSERVILVEGRTEEKILPALFQKVTIKTLGLCKTALVVMNGCKSTKKTIEVLKVMDIPTKALVDLDYALKNSESDGFLEHDDEDIAAIKSHLSSIASENNITLEGSWPKKHNGSLTPPEAFSLLAKEPAIQENIKNIKSKLETQNIWIWTKGTIENHLGGIEKNEVAWAEFNNKLKNENLSDLLPDDYNEIENLMNWIRN